MDQKQTPIELPHPNKIRLGYSEVHFRGVFATEDIEEGELIERCPIAVLGWRTNYQKDPVVWAYMYTSSCPCEECKRHGAHFVMVMGYGQIYNHQDENNASMNINLKMNIADVIAKKKILKGEEIFVSYGPKYFNGRNKVTVTSSQSDCKDSEVPPPPHPENVIRPL